MRTGIICCAVVVSSLVGCVQAQRPYQFQASSQDDATGVVARALTSAGWEVDAADQATGIVRTRYVPTPNFCARPQGNGKIFQRYVATVAPRGPSTEVALRVDAKCCDAENLEIGDMTVRSGCVQMEQIFDFQQEELDALGARLRAELSGPAAG